MPNAVKVLIAEDEPNALAGLAELISGWGYRTETARDGVELGKDTGLGSGDHRDDLKMRAWMAWLLAKLAEAAKG